MLSISEKLDNLRWLFGRKRCVICGHRRTKKSQLHFAHIKRTNLSYCPTGRGQTRRYYDIKKNPDCYVLVCWYCHQKYLSGPGF